MGKTADISLFSSRGGLLKGSQALVFGTWGVSLASGHWKVAGLDRANSVFGIKLKVLNPGGQLAKTNAHPGAG